MALNVRLPEVMELGEDSDTILVFGDCHRDSAVYLVQQLIESWGIEDPPTFQPEDLTYLPVIVEGTPIQQKDSPYPDAGYWWEGQVVGSGVSVVKPTRANAGWLVNLKYPE